MRRGSVVQLLEARTAAYSAGSTQSCRNGHDDESGRYPGAIEPADAIAHVVHGYLVPFDFDHSIGDGA